jgi:hypothetical protein
MLGVDLSLEERSRARPPLPVPPELMLEICDCLPSQDIRNMRLVAKRWDDYVTKTSWQRTGLSFPVADLPRRVLSISPHFSLF